MRSQAPIHHGRRTAASDRLRASTPSRLARSRAMTRDAQLSGRPTRRIVMRLMTETLSRPDTSAAGSPAIGGRARIRVAVVGATGYAGGEMVRILERHPNVRIVGLSGPGPGAGAGGREPSPPRRDRACRGRGAAPRRTRCSWRSPTGSPRHSAGDIVASGATIIDQGPDFRLRDPADYPAGTASSTRHRTCWRRPVYGLPELHRAELAALGDADVAIVGAPGCYPTTTHPRARAARAGRPHRGPRGGRQERRLGRRSGPQAGPDLQRGQRERQGVRHRRPPPRRRDRAGAGPAVASAGAGPGVRRRGLPAPPHPDDPGHPVGRPRPAHAPGDDRRAPGAVSRHLCRGAVRGGRGHAASHQARVLAATSRACS